jgi:hypothetical protein
MGAFEFDALRLHTPEPEPPHPGDPPEPPAPPIGDPPRFKRKDEVPAARVPATRCDVQVTNIAQLLPHEFAASA